MSSPALDAVLTRVRVRMLTYRLVAVAPWAVSGGAIAFGVARIVGNEGMVSTLVAVIVMIALIGGALTVWGGIRPLTDSRIARLIDDRLTLLDLFSTAREVEPEASVIATALAAYAEQRAAHVAATDVVSLRWPRAGTATLLAALAFVVASQLFTGPLASLLTGTQAGESPIAVDRVRELAALAETAAELERDPHMAAVALALRELADQASDSEATTVSDVENLRELLEALDRLATPSSRDGSRVGQSQVGDQATIESALTNLEERLTRQALFTGLGEEALVFPEDNWQSFATQEGAAIGDAPSADGAPARGEGPIQGPSPSAPSLTEATGEGEIESAYLIGASSDSSAGGSSMAGQGVQDLFGEDGASSAISGVDAVVVEGTRSDDGRMITMELPPDATEAPNLAGSLDFQSGRPRVLPEEGAGVLPPRYWSVAGSYFLPNQETVNR